MNRQILLMYITNVSGHHSATLAIERAIKACNPHPNVLNIDGFGYANPIMEKVIHAIYMGVINKIPSIWDFLYDNPKVAKNLSNIGRSVYRKNRGKIKKLIESENCKVAICSQAFPCGMVADYKRYCSNDIKLIAVVTDYVPHSYWIYDEVDFYIVGSEESKKFLLNKGVKEEKIKLFGIPIDTKFSKRLNKEETAKELNITLDRPVILIMGGGRGIGPIGKFMRALDKSEINTQLLIITGINNKLYNYLKNTKFRNKTYVYEYVDYVDKLMTVADILITKPGGVTTAEALAKNLPMLILQPLPGQEQNNTNFLLSQGVALKADDIDDSIAKLISLLKDKEKLNAIREKIAIVSKPLSSVKIAELALSL